MVLRGLSEGDAVDMVKRRLTDEEKAGLLKHAAVHGVRDVSDTDCVICTLFERESPKYRGNGPDSWRRAIFCSDVGRCPFGVHAMQNYFCEEHVRELQLIW